MSNKYENLINNIEDIDEVKENISSLPRLTPTAKHTFENYGQLLQSRNGLCLALVFMWGRAILLNDERTFFARLDLLTRDYQGQPLQCFGQSWDNLGKLLFTCHQRYIQNPLVQAGNPELALILSILPFLDDILLYQTSDESFLHKEQIKRHVQLQNPAVTSGTLGHGLISIFRKPFVGTIEYFKILFQQMVLDLKHSPDSQFFISIRTDNHSIGARLNLKSCSIFNLYYLAENQNIWNVENIINVEHMVDDFTNAIFQCFEKIGEKPSPHYQSFHYNYLNTVIEVWTLNEHRAAPRFVRTLKWYLDFYLPQMVTKGSRFRSDFLMNLFEFCPDDAGLLELFLINLHDDELSFLHPPIFLKACINGHLAVVLALLRHPEKFRFNMNKIMLKGYGPLHLAAQAGHAQIVRALLAMTPIDAKAIQNNYSALDLACTLGHLSVVEVFLSPEFRSRVDINPPVGPEFSPLGRACKNGFVDIILLLLKNGAKPARAMVQFFRESVGNRNRPDFVDTLRDLCP